MSRCCFSLANTFSCRPLNSKLPQENLPAHNIRVICWTPIGLDTVVIDTLGNHAILAVTAAASKMRSGCDTLIRSGHTSQRSYSFLLASCFPLNKPPQQQWPRHHSQLTVDIVLGAPPSALIRLSAQCKPNIITLHHPISRMERRICRLRRETMFMAIGRRLCLL